MVSPQTKEICCQASFTMSNFQTNRRSKLELKDIVVHCIEKILFIEKNKHWVKVFLFFFKYPDLQHSSVKKTMSLFLPLGQPMMV